MTGLEKKNFVHQVQKGTCGEEALFQLLKSYYASVTEYISNYNPHFSSRTDTVINHISFKLYEDALQGDT